MAVLEAEKIIDRQVLSAWSDLVRECLHHKASLHTLLVLCLQYLPARTDLDAAVSAALQKSLTGALDRYAAENPTPADVDFLFHLDPASDWQAFAQVQQAFTSWNILAGSWCDQLTDLSRHLFRNNAAQKQVARALTDTTPPPLPAQSGEVKRRLRSIAFFEALLGEIEMFAPPQWLILDQNNTCNFKCKMCLQHAEGIKFAPAYFTALKNLEPNIAWAGQITLGGTGEPLLHPSLSALLRNKLPETAVTINTNGSLLDKHGDQLEGMDAIDISFDGDNPETFEALRLGGHFKPLVENIRKFCKLHPEKRISLNVVVSRVNADEIYGICALAVELGIRYVILSPIYANGPLGFLCLQPEDEVRLKLQFERLETDFPGKITVISGILPGNLTGHAEKTNATKSALLTRLKQTRYGEPVSLQTLPEILQSLPALADFSWWPHPPAKPEISNPPAYELATATARDMQLAQRLLASSRIKFPYCLAPWIIAYVHAQGTVRPCCFYPRTLDESLHDKPLAEIWNSPAFRDLRAAMLGWHELPAACRACEASMRQVYKNPLIDFAGQYGFQHSKTEDVLEFKPQVFFTP